MNFFKRPGGKGSFCFLCLCSVRHCAEGRSDFLELVGDHVRAVTAMMLSRNQGDEAVGWRPQALRELASGLLPGMHCKSSSLGRKAGS
jgi:hypothetical protein